MKPFSKPEIISIVVIFLILSLISAPNFVVSLRRARDQIRRDDLGNIESTLDAYYVENKLFPKSSSDGRIIACNNLPCKWGQDPFFNMMPIIPGDPDTNKGASYIYLSDGKRYQIYAALESRDEAGYDAKIEARNISCGKSICNIGRSYLVPIDISIEEYVKQLNDNAI